MCALGATLKGRNKGTSQRSEKGIKVIKFECYAYEHAICMHVYLSCACVAVYHVLVADRVLMLTLLLIEEFELAISD